MPSKFPNVAIFSFAASMLLLCGPTVPRVFGDQFWYELTSSSIPKAETLPDFVSMADKLGPTVVNISTEQAGPAASEGEGGGSEGGAARAEATNRSTSSASRLASPTAVASGPASSSTLPATS